MGRGEDRLGRPVGAVLVAALIFSGGVISGRVLPPSDVRDLKATSGSDPNVLLIVTDDQRVATLDAMPFTTRYFGTGGVTFRNSFTATPLCCPSRASIMSGRYPHNHKVARNAYNGRLDQNSVLQRYLQRDGYLTGFAGKYFNGWRETQEPPPHFDRWATIDDSAYSNVYENFLVNLDGTVVHPDAYSTDFISETTQGFLRDFENADDRPWFMFVSPFAPHEPFTAARKYADAPVAVWQGSPAVAEVDRSDKPSWVNGRSFPLELGREVAAKQRRTLMSVDDLLRDVVALLKELDEERETLVIFVSDNGYLWGEHGISSKRVPYTNSIKVPLMVRWAGRFPEGIRDKRLAMTIDIVPTVLRAAKIEPNPRFPLDGRPLLGVKPRSEMLIEYFGAFEFGGVPEWASLRTKTYQYVEYYSPSDGTVVFREYYDLERDPFQLANLLDDHDPANDPPTEKLSRRLSAARECAGSDCLLVSS
jgi:arylsulfatase A-like enzyme